VVDSDAPGTAANTPATGKSDGRFKSKKMRDLVATPVKCLVLQQSAKVVRGDGKPNGLPDSCTWHALLQPFHLSLILLGRCTQFLVARIVTTLGEWLLLTQIFGILAITFDKTKRRAFAC